MLFFVSFCKFTDSALDNRGGGGNYDASNFDLIVINDDVSGVKLSKFPVQKLADNAVVANI